MNTGSSPAPVASARGRESVMTRASLAVVIVLGVIVLILIAPALKVLLNPAQAGALSNARAIAMSLRFYAEDNGDNFPTYTLHNGKPTTTPVSDSNSAFAQLFPNYINEEEIFWVKGSAFCSPAPSDEVMDNPPLDTPVNTLKAGENEWAYVLALTDKSDPTLPLMAGGFSNPATHTYSKDPHQKGGRWRGRTAIVIRVDSSASVMTVDQNTMTVTGPNDGAAPGDIFTTANSANGWLTPANRVVNPK